MPTDIKMPKLGESVTEGTVGRWLKQPGEHVEKYEPLLEVTTDKVDTEVPAPAAGIVREIAVPEGTTVRVGTLLAVLDDEDGSAENHEPESRRTEEPENLELRTQNSELSESRGGSGRRPVSLRQRNHTEQRKRLPDDRRRPIGGRVHA